MSLPPIRSWSSSIGSRGGCPSGGAWWEAGTAAAGSIGAGLLVVAHPAPQRRGPHVGPGLVDVGQAVILGAREAVAAPADGQVPPRWPDRVLLLGIDHDRVRQRLLSTGHQPLPSAAGAPVLSSSCSR